MLCRRRLSGFFPLILFILLLSPGCGGGGGDSGSTPPVPVPLVTTTGASSINIDNAVLHGTANPNGLATTVWFEWGTSPTLATWDNTLPPKVLPAGFVVDNVTFTKTGLSSGTNYWYRVAATNSAGTSKGNIIPFTTASVSSPPTVALFAADNASITGMTLHGNVGPNGSSTNAYFVYGPDSTLTNLVTTSKTTTRTYTGMVSVPIDEPISSLSPGTLYYFKLVAGNAYGSVETAISSKSTNTISPTVLTKTAVPATDCAVFNGTVNPNGLATTAWFEWGTSSTLATWDNTPSQVLGAGFVVDNVTFTKTGLSSGTNYWYRVAATNSAGTSKGNIVPFTTATPDAGPPTAQTLGATGISTGGATLNGTLNPNGLATDAYFEWGTLPTLPYINTTINQPLGSGFADLSIGASLTGLISGTTYYYRVNATNSAGPSTGTILSLTTSSLGRGTFTYNSSGQNAKVTTGDGNSVIFSKYLPAVTNFAGVFSLDFSPTLDFGSGGYISIRLMDTHDTYFQLSTKDASVTKVRKGVVVDSAAFPFPYNQGNSYPIKITFSQSVTTFEAFGGTVSLTLNTDANPIPYFEVETTQQDAFYDNMKLETGNPLAEVYFDDFITDTTGTYLVF